MLWSVQKVLAQQNISRAELMNGKQTYRGRRWRESAPRICQNTRKASQTASSGGPGGRSCRTQQVLMEQKVQQILNQTPDNTQNHNRTRGSHVDLKNLLVPGLRKKTGLFWPDAFTFCPQEVGLPHRNPGNGKSVSGSLTFHDVLTWPCVWWRPWIYLINVVFHSKLGI